METSITIRQDSDTGDFIATVGDCEGRGDTLSEAVHLLAHELEAIGQ
jgi:hypothetical protein